MLDDVGPPASPNEQLDFGVCLFDQLVVLFAEDDLLEQSMCCPSTPTNTVIPAVLLAVYLSLDRSTDDQVNF